VRIPWTGRGLLYSANLFDDQTLSNGTRTIEPVETYNFGASQFGFSPAKPALQRLGAHFSLSHMLLLSACRLSSPIVPAGLKYTHCHVPNATGLPHSPHALTSLTTSALPPSSPFPSLSSSLPGSSAFMICRRSRHGVARRPSEAPQSLCAWHCSHSVLLGCSMLEIALIVYHAR
jgi:hypothetical protein